MVNKNKIRKNMLQARSNIPIDARNIKSSEIFKLFINTNEYKSSKTIGVYLSFNYEVNTEELIYHALKDNKIIVVPKITSNKEMEFVPIDTNFKNNLWKNKWGFKEPKNNDFIEKNKIDTIIVPMVAFDANNNRVGYGKGFYDRYLSNFNGNIIGFAFSEQKSSEIIATEPFDIKLNCILFN